MMRLQPEDRTTAAITAAKACGCSPAARSVADRIFSTTARARQSQRAPPQRTVWLPARRVEIGTANSPLPADGEGPPRSTSIRPFGIDPYAVTNDWFAEFVAETEYRTDAERFGWSLVFHSFVRGGPAYAGGHGPVSWWRRVDGASWRHPEGPESDIANRGLHPVVHVSWQDAMAFAAWAGGRLPSEAEWERAAQGVRGAARYPWGAREPNDVDFFPCNIWQGHFPYHDTAADGFAGTAPADAFAANDAGLHNMVGNTWEWCADAFRVRSLAASAKHRNQAAAAGGERLMKGGSYLCHRSYCYRYRIAARTGAGADSSTGHVGFRVVFDPLPSS